MGLMTEWGSNNLPYLKPTCRSCPVVTCPVVTSLMVTCLVVFVFVSGGGQPAGGLKLVRRLSLLSEEDLWSMNGLPNQTFPSDHLSLLARFHLEVPPEVPLEVPPESPGEVPSGGST